MLRVSKAVMLGPSPFRATLAPATFALLRVLGSRATHAGASYAEFKAAASRTGDPAKEWVSGATHDGAGVTRMLHLDAEGVLEGMKRGAEEMTEVAMEACETRAMKEVHVSKGRELPVFSAAAASLESPKNHVPPNEGRTFPA